MDRCRFDDFDFRSPPAADDCLEEELGASDWDRGIDSIALSVDWGSLMMEEPVSLLESRERDLKLHLSRS